MKVIIAGSRHYNPELADTLVENAIAQAGWNITHVINGTATGIDQAGARWAKKNNKTVINYPPDWKTHGKKAGPLRNTQMLNNADALILIWDGKSKGSKNMLTQAKNKKIPIFETITPQKEEQ